jgi:hypothetical protein
MQVVKLVSLFSFLLLMLMFQPATAQAPAGLAKPNCSDRCGNISIPYPFGIGKDCYMAESFDVKCDETSKPPRAFLRSIKMELVNITLERGAVVEGPVISVDSSGRQEGVPVNLEGTPFTPYYNSSVQIQTLAIFLYFYIVFVFLHFAIFFYDFQDVLIHKIK